MSRVGTIAANLAEVYSNQIRTALRRDASQRLTEPS